MKSFSLPTRLFLSLICIIGTGVLFLRIGDVKFEDSRLLVVLCALASLALVLKVKGAHKRSYYTFSYVIYGFAFAQLGVVDAILVLLVSHVVEWIWYSTRWTNQVYKVSAYLVTMGTAAWVYFEIQQAGFLPFGRDVIGIAVAMGIFTLLNHFMMGTYLWLRRDENFRKSGVFAPFPLVLDVSLLYLGATLSIVWESNPYAIVLFIFPAYLLYGALRVPALERMTELDGKTGLFNHTYFRKQLDSELARSNRFDRPLAVIIADLDLLRNINNTYGHLAGDEVLIGVAKAMKRSVREYDVVSRFGGEEFAILMPETTLAQAYDKAEFFRKTIEEMEFTVLTSQTPIRATMSFGVAQRENSRQTSTEIVHNADLAVYNSKLSGRNRTFAHTSEAHFDLPAMQMDYAGELTDVDGNAPGACKFESYMPGMFK
jgi:diguanylate cyclase (GGDEF)-like protein